MAFLAAADPPQETTPMANTSRRDFIGLLGGAATWPTWAQGETRGKDPTIGVLWHAGDAEEEKFPLSLFRQGLQDVGYVEGQNITVHHRFPAEQPERFYALADELVRLNVDILFTVTRLAALAAQRATKTIPIVFVAVADPVGSKLINSLRALEGTSRDCQIWRLS
jgi:putative tryptophan/tyrosine transport system substrate-binding protein